MLRTMASSSPSEFPLCWRPGLAQSLRLFPAHVPAAGLVGYGKVVRAWRRVLVTAAEVAVVLAGCLAQRADAPVSRDAGADVNGRRIHAGPGRARSRRK